MNEKKNTNFGFKKLSKFVNPDQILPSTIIRGYLFYDWKVYECQEIGFTCKCNLNFRLNNIIIQFYK